MRRLALVIAAAATLTLTAAACGDDHGAGHGDMPMDGAMPMGSDMPMGDMPMTTGDMPMEDTPMGDMPMGDMPMAGGDHGNGHRANSPVPEGARMLDMRATSFSFAPSTVTARPGEPIGINLTATDIEHDLVIDEVDAHVYATGGETTSGGFTAPDAGTYAYYCSIPGHREAGMEGTLVVEG